MTNPYNSPYAKARNEVLRTITALPPHLQVMLMQELNLYFWVKNDASEIEGAATLGVRQQGQEHQDRGGGT